MTDSEPPRPDQRGAHAYAHNGKPDSSVLEQTARKAARLEQQAREVPEPSLGSRLGQIGMLGWVIVFPALLCLWLGHWLDRRFGTGVFFSAPLLMIGAAIGLWCAWRWMHRQSTRS